MDPFTIIGVIPNVAQIVNQAVTIFVNLSKYYQHVRDAPTHSKELREELDSLVDILAEVQETFERTEIPKSLQKELETVEKLLRTLHRRAQPNETQGIRRLRWPFRQADNDDAIRKIERFKTKLNIILNTGNLYQLPAPTV